MEEENSVFGADAKNTDKINTEENFNFYHKNKETAKKDIDKSAKELTDFIDSLSMDVPELSEEEINKGIEKILERTHPSETQSESVKNSKSKKVTFKVLFLVALLSIVSFSCLYVVGSSHNISIENGFISFAKETVQVVFFGEDKEEYISVDSLLANLEEHGYKDILFPQEFVTHSDEYKVSVPEYLEGELEQVSFDIDSETAEYIFGIYKYTEASQAIDYIDVVNAQTLLVDNIHIYTFDFGNGDSAVEFIHNGYRYYIHAHNVSYSSVINIAETVK